MTNPYLDTWKMKRDASCWCENVNPYGRTCGREMPCQWHDPHLMQMRGGNAGLTRIRNRIKRDADLRAALIPVLDAIEASHS